MPLDHFSPATSGYPRRHLSLIESYGADFFVAGTFTATYGRQRHEPKEFFERKIEMTENEVKNLHKIKCELRFSEPKNPASE